MEVNIWALLAWTLYAIIISCVIVPLAAHITVSQILEAINNSKINYLTKLDKLYTTQEGESNGER